MDWLKSKRNEAQPLCSVAPPIILVCGPAATIGVHRHKLLFPTFVCCMDDQTICVCLTSSSLLIHLVKIPTQSFATKNTYPNTIFSIEPAHLPTTSPPDHDNYQFSGRRSTPPPRVISLQPRAACASSGRPARPPRGGERREKETIGKHEVT